MRHAVGLTIVAVAVTSTAGLALLGGVGSGPGSSVPMAVAGVLWAAVGAVIVLRKPRHSIGWILAASGLLSTTGWFIDAVAHHALVQGRLPYRLGVVAIWYSHWWWIPWLFLGLVFLPMVIPTGRLPSRRWRPLAWTLSAAATIGVLGAMLQDRLSLYDPEVPDSAPSVANPIGVMPFADVETSPLAVFFFAILVGIVAGVTALVVRLRRSRGTERQQIKLVVFAGILAAAAFLGGVVIDTVTGGWRPPVLDAAASAFVPVAIGIAILRHRLFDIDRVVNRTVVYAGVTAVVAGLYAMVAILPSAVFQLGEESELVVAAATLVAAGAFGPVRRRTQSFVDRRFDRARYDARRTVESFSHRLRNEVELQNLEEQLIGVVTATVRPARISLWFAEDRS